MTVSWILSRVLSPNYPDVLALRQGQASRAALRQGPIRRHPLQHRRKTVSDPVFFSPVTQCYCFISAITFALFLSNSAPDQGKGLCKGHQANINCLKQNFRELYQKDYKQFWDILYYAEERALSCHSIPITTDFLEIIRVIGSNAEVSEYFSETIETKLLQRNPQCFLNALLAAEVGTKRKIIDHL